MAAHRKASQLHRCVHIFLKNTTPPEALQAVQINNKELKWRTETSPMAARGNSSSNYTTKHSVGFFRLTATRLFPLLLNSSLFGSPSLSTTSRLSLEFLTSVSNSWRIFSFFVFFPPSFAFGDALCTTSHHHLSSPLLTICRLPFHYKLYSLFPILLPVMCPIVYRLAITMVSSPLPHLRD